jgi:D-hydroxyproline dehydrogenase subunit beta
MDRTADIAIVGGGIAGLAHAYMALKKKKRVVLFDREQFVIGASVRNFGLIWPIGQEPGIGLSYALRSVEVWKEVSREAGFWLNANGSLHLAHEDDEVQVLEEFLSLFDKSGYDCEFVSARRVQELSTATKAQQLRGGLWSKTELTVNPREAIRRIPKWLEERFGLITRFGNVVTEIRSPLVVTPSETWKVDQVIICSGADFETLYPEVFQTQALTKCRLQMMKLAAKPITVGPSLCAGLTLRHYAAFRKCPGLKKVDERFDRLQPDFKKHGIHVLVSQNSAGELIVGDSHHYGETIEPFDLEEVNNLILSYLKTFFDFGDSQIIERWHGVYPKLQDKINLILQPEKNVTIVNGLGGAGMTLGFGVAEEVINSLT